MNGINKKPNYGRTVALLSISLGLCLPAISLSATKATTTIETKQPTSSAHRQIVPIQKQPIATTDKPKLISLNFNKIAVKKLLQILGQFSGINFVISDKITGDMTIHLQNVTWKNALDVILETQKLGTQKIDTTLMVAPMADITAAKLEKLKAQESVQDAEPLAEKLIFLKYANSEEVANMLTSGSKIIGKRGLVKSDKRTNSLLIRDTPKMMKNILNVINRIDTPVKQVEIDSRIVTIKKEFEEEFGARMGITNPHTLSGSLEGANALQDLRLNNPIRKQIAEQYYNNSTYFENVDNRLMFNNPHKGNIFRTTEAFKAGRFAFSLLRIGHNLLDLELTALEGEKHILDLASPRIITSDNQKATIKQGEKVPYLTTSPSGGSTVTYQDALLELTITPQITPDKHILLLIHITNNSTSATSTGQGDAPVLNTEAIDSTILLDNNETVVLGGIYKEDKTKKKIFVPILGQIPIIGRLFSYDEDQDSKDELLIFLTPHIVDKPSELSPEFLENGTL